MVSCTALLVSSGFSTHAAYYIKVETCNIWFKTLRIEYEKSYQGWKIIFWLLYIIAHNIINAYRMLIGPQHSLWFSLS